MALTEFGRYLALSLVFIVCLSLSIHFGVEYNKDKENKNKNTTYLALSLTFGVISVILFGFFGYKLFFVYKTRKMLEEGRNITVHLH